MGERVNSIFPLDRTPHRGNLLRRAVASICHQLQGLETSRRAFTRGVAPRSLCTNTEICGRLQIEARLHGRLITPLLIDRE